MNAFQRRPYNDGLDEVYQLRYRPEDRERWQRATDAAGIELAQWIRKTLNEAAARELLSR